MTPQETIMKNCMLTNTYDGCDITKCRACVARKKCDKKTWEAMGGK